MKTTDIIEFFNDSSTYWGSCSNEDVEIPFDITAEEYLQFVNLDLLKRDKRNLVNSLSNSKRALDCQIETLLYSFCLIEHTNKKKMNIPQKIELLNQIGIVAPRILNKINKIRNVMEHEFYCPSQEEAEDFADIITLFIHYTNMYIKDVRCRLEIFNEQKFKELFIKPYLDRENQKVDFTIYVDFNYKEPIDITVDFTDDNYIELIKAYIRIIKL